MMIDPVTCAVLVPLPPTEAFSLFVNRLGEWWPLESNSLGLRNAATCGMEPRQGGRLYERTAEGLEALWGTITEFEAPSRVAFTWHPGRHASTAQTVTLTFTPATGGTRIVLVHGGWERAGERAGWLRERYAEGWPGVLARFQAKAGGAGAKTSRGAPFHG